MNLTAFIPAIVSAFLYFLAMPDMDLSLLGFVAIAPLTVSAILSPDLKTAFMRGLAGGILYAILVYYWLIETMHTFGGLAYPISTAIFLLLAVYLASYWAIYALIIRKTDAFPVLITAPLFWVALEFLRTHLFTGFPWALLAYSQHGNINFIQLADITGAYGISFILAFISALFASAYLCYRKKGNLPYGEAVAFILITVTVYSYGIWRISSLPAASHHIDTVLVQGNIDQTIKWDRRFLEETITIYTDLTIESASGGKRPDLVIWPETAVPFYFQQEGLYRKKVMDTAARLSAPILFGSPAYSVSKSGVSYLNRAYLIAPDIGGRVLVTGTYDKHHLVPFGEYVPLKKILFFVNKITEGIGDFMPGEGVKVLHVSGASGEAALAPLICYEGIFPDLTRRFVKGGANILVNITNDAWYGRTSAPYQHIAASVFRAVENRVSLLRAANTGVSAIIDRDGRLNKSLDIFERGIVRGSAGIYTAGSFYSKYGDIFSMMACIASIFIVLYAYYMERRL